MPYYRRTITLAASLFLVAKATGAEPDKAGEKAETILDYHILYDSRPANLFVLEHSEDDDVCNAYLTAANRKKVHDQSLFQIKSYNHMSFIEATVTTELSAPWKTNRFEWARVDELSADINNDGSIEHVQRESSLLSTRYNHSVSLFSRPFIGEWSMSNHTAYYRNNIIKEGTENMTKRVILDAFNKHRNEVWASSSSNQIVDLIKINKKIYAIDSPSYLSKGDHLRISVSKILPDFSWQPLCLLRSKSRFTSSGPKFE